MATLLLVVAAATSHSPPVQPYWWSCATPRHECKAYALKRHVGQQTHGYWQSCKARCTIFPYWRQRVKPVVRQVTRAVRAVGHGAFYPITGYSWGCGANGPNPQVAEPGVGAPYVGAVASDIFPFGTRIYVPSLGYSGVVVDRGVGTGGFDLFEASCSLTYKDTGYREVVIG